jgi:hypothetical protein
MSGFSVPGFNIFDHIFSRDVSELSLEQTRFVQPIKKNLFKEVARGHTVMPTFGEGFNTTAQVPTGVPGPPTNIEARMVAGQIEVFFIPPTTGGSPIIYYTIASNPPGIRGVNIQNMDKVRLSGWAPGTQYTFKVTAINENGIGTASAESNILTTPALTDSQKQGLVARSKRSNARPLNTPAIPFVNVLGPNLFRYIIRDPNPDLVYEVIITDSKIGAEVCRINNNSDAHRSDELYVSLPDPNRKYEFKFVTRRINEDGTFGEASAPYTMPFCANAGTVVEELGCGTKPGDSKVGYRRQKIVTNNYKNFAGECVTQDVYTCNSFCPDFKGPNGCYVPTPQQAERDKVAAKLAAEEKAAADRLAAQQANARRAAEQKAAADKLAAEKAIADKEAADKAAAQLVARQLAEAERVATKKAAADKAIADKAAADRLAAQKAAEEEAAQQAAAKISAKEKADAEKAIADKAAADKAAAQLAATKLAATKAAEEVVRVERAAKELAQAQADAAAAAAARKVAEDKAKAVKAAKDKAAADLLALRLATTEVSQREKEAIEKEGVAKRVLEETETLYSKSAAVTSTEIAAAKDAVAQLIIKHKRTAETLAAELEAAQKKATQKLMERQAAERKLAALKQEEMKAAFGWPYLVNRV